MLPPALASSRPTAVPSAIWEKRGDEHQAQHQAQDGRHRALAADRLHHRVGGVDADQHQHEEEQHQDGAGVDDDLHGEEERRVQDGVQHGEADHHDGEQQRGVHGLADEQDAERGHHHDRGEDPEGHQWLPSPRAGPVGHQVRGSAVGAAVVVALVVAEAHRVRRLLHAGQQRRQQVGLLVDEVGPVVVGQLVLVGHRQRARRAGLDAQPAQDAAQVVDLVDAAVALTGAEALPSGRRCWSRPRRRSRRPGTPRRTARSRCTSRARRASG